MHPSRYCSKDCQVKAWRDHKHDCHLYKEYIIFAKKATKSMSSKTIIDFWLEKEQRQDKPLCRDNAVRMCNSLLHHAFMNRQEMGHMLMMQTHILNAAFLRQSCASSVKHIAKAFQARSSDNEFLKDFPYFKDGQL